MFRRVLGNKGIALYMVVASILVALIFSGVILSLVLSQSRFSLHNTGRLQAYYAAMAGATLAFEMFRTGTWATSGFPINHDMCQSLASPPAGCSCDIEEPNLPNAISCISIRINGSTGPTGALRISTTAVYTTPS